MRFLIVLALLLSTSVHAAQGQVTVKIKLPDDWECIVGRLPEDQCDQDEDPGMDEQTIVEPEPQTYYDPETNTQITL